MKNYMTPFEIGFQLAETGHGEEEISMLAGISRENARLCIAASEIGCDIQEG